MNDNDKSTENQVELNKKRVEEIIDKKILEAKILITEKRLNYFLVIAGGLFIIFGLIIPLYLAAQSTYKVDNAIEKMENSFKDLAGKQLRNPDLDCYVEGKRLENSTLIIDNNRSIDTYRFEIRNIGDGVAREVLYRLYLKGKNEWKSFSGNFHLIEINDEPGFSQVFEWDNFFLFIPPQGSKIFDIPIRSKNLKDEEKVEAMLKIFYGEPEPVKIKFTFEKKP